MTSKRSVEAALRKRRRTLDQAIDEMQKLLAAALDDKFRNATKRIKRSSLASSSFLAFEVLKALRDGHDVRKQFGIAPKTAPPPSSATIFRNHWIRAYFQWLRKCEPKKYKYEHLFRMQQVTGLSRSQIRRIVEDAEPLSIEISVDASTQAAFESMTKKMVRMLTTPRGVESKIS